MRKVRIENLGLPAVATKVTDAETGEPIHGIVAIDIHIGVHGDPEVVLTIDSGFIEIEAQAETRVRHRPWWERWALWLM